jgi:hypothetical protein
MLALFILPGCAQEDLKLPNIFICPVSDDSEPPQVLPIPESAIKKAKPKKKEAQEEIYLDLSSSGTYATTLKGYAEYRDATNEIFMKDSDRLVLNIRKPQKFVPVSLTNSRRTIQPQTGKFSANEYKIVPSAVNSTAKVGAFSFGTTYTTAIDNSQLEEAASMFTRYEYKKFALGTSYRRTTGATSGMFNDSFFIAPEYRLNSVFTIRDIVRQDITKERITNEVVLSMQPLKGSDRLRFDAGVGQTFDKNRELLRTKIQFTTQFRF